MINGFDMFSFAGIDGNFTEYNWFDENRDAKHHLATYSQHEPSFFGADNGILQENDVVLWNVPGQIESSLFGQGNVQENCMIFDEVFSQELDDDHDKGGNISPTCEDNNKEACNRKRTAAVRKTSDSVPTFIRIGATVRERSRMHVLNEAFDELRKVIPKSNLSEQQRLSKIATLRQAIQYIDALVRTLESSGVEIRKANGYCVGDMRGKRRTCRKRSL